MKEADLLKQLQRVRLTFKTFTTQMIPTTLSVTLSWRQRMWMKLEGTLLVGLQRW